MIDEWIAIFFLIFLLFLLSPAAVASLPRPVSLA